MTSVSSTWLRPMLAVAVGWLLLGRSAALASHGDSADAQSQDEEPAKRMGFVRIGKAPGAEDFVPTDEALEGAEDKRSFVRIGKAPGFVRIGRAPGFVRIGKAPGFVRIGKAPGFVRIGKAPGFVRIGKSSPQEGLEQDIEDKRSFVRIGRTPGFPTAASDYDRTARPAGFVRIGKSLGEDEGEEEFSPEDGDLEKRSAFVRIGRAPGFVRIGKALEDAAKRYSQFIRIGRGASTEDDAGALDKRFGSFVRIGRSGEDSDLEGLDKRPSGFVRIGRLPQSAFVRIGKNYGLGAYYRPARLNFVRIGRSADDASHAARGPA